jgi:DNA-binding transcriptional ArsR family regulator
MAKLSDRLVLLAVAASFFAGMAGEEIFHKDIRIKRVTTLSHVAAQGLSDPVRLRILEILGAKPMSADEIAKALGSAGHKKATTTVRHHLDTLKQAGLIEAAKMVEVRGAVMKYYSATLKVYSCEAPADLDTKAARLIDDASTKIAKIINGIRQDKRFSALDKDGKCSEFLVLEIINAALVKAVERKGQQPPAGKSPEARQQHKQ